MGSLPTYRLTTPDLDLLVVGTSNGKGCTVIRLRPEASSWLSTRTASEWVGIQAEEYERVS